MTRPARGKERSQAGENVYDVNATRSRIYSRLSGIREADWRNEGATRIDGVAWTNARTTIVPSPFTEESAWRANRRGGGGRRSTFRRIEDDRVRARSSGLGRLGLGLVTLCLVKAVDQRLNDELDRKLVDVLHVLRISVLQCTLHRIQKRFLDFLEVERLVITVIRNYKIKGFKIFQEKRVILLFCYI